MNEKINLIYSTFKYSAISQLKQEDTYALALAVGAYQGLKYKGNLKRGIQTGCVIVGVMAVCNGIQNVAVHWDKIKRA